MKRELRIGFIDRDDDEIELQIENAAGQVVYRGLASSEPGGCIFVNFEDLVLELKIREKESG